MEATMDLNYPANAESFRRQIRAWIEGRLPPGWTEGRRTGPEAEAFPGEWNRLLHQTGWSCPTWPQEFGGRGLTIVQAVVWAEELARADAPIQPPAGGELLVGPTILQWGTDEQKRRFLPKIVRGDEIWCQGFSEPGAGSDLASLSTEAVADGDEWRIDGHKIWTSQGQEADYIFLLARTNPDAPKHRGISYLLVPARQPGIEVRPIVQPDGTAGFSEVLCRDARCPVGNVVGGVDNGWKVAMSTLSHERGTSATSSWQRYERDWWVIVDDARRRGLRRDAVLRQRLARAWSQIQLMRVNGYRVVTGIIHPEVADQSRAVEAGTKTYWTEFHQELTNLGIDVAGPAGQILLGGAPAPGVGLGHRPVVHPYPAGELQSAFLFSRAGTIFGGTAQVQRNIIGERVLGLPREPSVTT
jgi:alkylation response protein AidB-like acyl-CoA dehydrogenase